jgi:hypothetical protein
MRRGPVVCWACVCAGCGAELAAIEGLQQGPDANNELDLGDAGVGVCPNGRAVYLHFEGQALTKAASSDATQNYASWMDGDSGTAPRYRDNAMKRDEEIAAIVAGVRAQFATFPIAVVTERPASAPYVMVVFGGDAEDVQSAYNTATNTLDCGDVNKNDVAWIADRGAATQRVVNLTIGAIGYGLGLTGTTDPKDCMCGWDSACDADNTTACTLSAQIERDPKCDGVTTQNEVAAFKEQFCQ